MSGCTESTDGREDAMKPYAVLALAGYAAGVGAWSAQAQSVPSVQVTDSAGVRIVQNDLTGPLPVCPVTGPEVTIGQLNGPEEYQLSRVWGARRLLDGRIVLMNVGSSELRFYDSTGVFLSRSGFEAQGPGVNGLWVTIGDTLWVGESRPWKYALFDPTGEYLRTVQLEPRQPFTPILMTVLDGGYSLSAHPGP